MRLRKRSGINNAVVEVIRNPQALAVAYDRDATCCENKLRKHGFVNFLGEWERNTLEVGVSVIARAFLRANLRSMKEREGGQRKR